MDIIERFLKYVSFDTQSAEDSDSVPSTAKQLVFAKYLRDELKDEGFDDVEMDDNGYVYATLKSNMKKDVPTIGFISHYDTSPDCSGANVKPRLIKNYDGEDIELSPGIVNLWTNMSATRPTTNVMSNMTITTSSGIHHANTSAV